MTTKCAGMNCQSTDGTNHSPECLAEHAAAVAGGRFVKLPRGEDEAREENRNAIALLTAPKLPDWFDTFLTNVCEIPDRNSPEDEPEAIIATLEELRDCALNAISNEPFDESASCEVEAAALRAYDHAIKDGFTRDLESYCAGYIDRHYTAPPAASGQKLTDEHILQLVDKYNLTANPTDSEALAFARALLRADKE